MTTQLTNKNRIESIDVLRGVVMIIMALDHVRDFFHIDAFVDDPLNLATTTPVLYFTRWITHLCAPTFVFLSGVSIYLQSLRKTKKELSAFIIKRGLWLIFAECALVTLAVTFDPLYHVVLLTTIWAIGISMVVLGFMVYLPYKVILVIGLTIVLGHNLLDIPESAAGFKAGFWWDLLHHGYFVPYTFAPDHALVIVYPFVPWTGLMILGYCAGIFFTPAYSRDRRRKITLSIGIGLLAFFVVIRFINFYGDPFPWKEQDNIVSTLFSFLKVHKYPPSLLYMSVTIGIAFLLLSVLEKFKNRFTSIAAIFGRTAFFYYIIHFFVIHVLATIVFFAKGQHTVQDALNSVPKIPFLFVIPGEGYGLGTVYIIWAALVIALYPLCKGYDTHKTNHKEKWWLSYL